MGESRLRGRVIGATLATTMAGVMLTGCAHNLIGKPMPADPTPTSASRGIDLMAFIADDQGTGSLMRVVFDEGTGVGKFGTITFMQNFQQESYACAPYQVKVVQPAGASILQVDGAVGMQVVSAAGLNISAQYLIPDDDGYRLGFSNGRVVYNDQLPTPDGVSELEGYTFVRMVPTDRDAFSRFSKEILSTDGILTDQEC